MSKLLLFKDLYFEAFRNLGHYIVSSLLKGTNMVLCGSNRRNIIRVYLQTSNRVSNLKLLSLLDSIKKALK